MGKKILLVDDSPSIRHVMAVAMETEGFTVITALDGLDGMQKLDVGSYDLVVSDLNMPNMNGFEFVKAVKQHSQNKFAKVIMLTTESTEHMKNKGRDIGVNVWVVKPFRKEQLIAVINKLTGN